MPLVIQDRSFLQDGRLSYPSSRIEFDGFTGPFRDDPAAQSDVAPIWNPEVFGNTICVNGSTWPFLEVEPRRYRLRIYNGCDARTLILRLGNGASFFQVGTEGGLLPSVVERSELLLMSGMRVDVVVDFTTAAGQTVHLVNVGPDEPFGGGVVGADFEPADPETTGQVLEFRVTATVTSPDGSLPVDQIVLPALSALPAAVTTRRVAMLEYESLEVDHNGHALEQGAEAAGPVCGMLGVIGADGNAIPFGWASAVTESIELGSTEDWEIHNLTEDAHPLHRHQVQFEILGRGADGHEPPHPWETGRQDIVIVYPKQITRIRATFDIPGRFEWHCHIIEHEDNEMMRPFDVGPVTPPRPPLTTAAGPSYICVISHEPPVAAATGATTTTGVTAAATPERGSDHRGPQITIVATGAAAMVGGFLDLRRRRHTRASIHAEESRAEDGAL